ncbi:hypothetical protein KCU61_g633, partial [Aureobasidium melanogenum]
LDTLSVGRTASEDVFTGLVATDEADGLDGRFVNHEVDSLCSTVNNVDDTGREASLLCKLTEDHHGTRVALGRLDDNGVSGKLKGQMAATTPRGSLYDLVSMSLATSRTSPSTEDITLGISKGLALLQSDRGSQTVPVLSDQMDELEHDLLSVQQTSGLPCREGLLGRCHCCLEFFIGGLRDTGDEVVGRGIMEIDPLCGVGGNELVVEEVLCVDGLLDLILSGRQMELSASQLACTLCRARRATAPRTRNC